MLLVQTCYVGEDGEEILGFLFVCFVRCMQKLIDWFSVVGLP